MAGSEVAVILDPWRDELGYQDESTGAAVMAMEKLVITGYTWDYTFYKWGFLSTYNWYFGP